MEIILEGVNPRTFNLVASLVAELLQLAGAFSLCSLLALLVSIYMRNSNKIPAKALGPLPDGVIAAWQYARGMKWAWPATLALFLFMSEYSTAIAFAGLDFVDIETKGEMAPVFNLTHRNDHFPYEAIGDPVLPYTASQLDLLLESPGFYSSSSQQEELDILNNLAREDRMVAAFLGSADTVARGESVFLEQNQDILDAPTLFLGQEDKGFLEAKANATVLYSDHKPLAAIRLAIPLNCKEDDMVTIEEHRGVGGQGLKTTSRVPNCTVTSTRASGIYQEEDDGTKAEITAYARVGSGMDAQLYFEGQQSSPIQDGSTFIFPYNGVPLAWERKDFREGRRVFGFGGVKLGDADIPFGMSLVSAGQVVANTPSGLQTDSQAREYTLVSQVKDAETNCPDDPSGTEDSVCMVTIKIACERFDSEIGSGMFPNMREGSDGHFECVFTGDVEIIWGRNYYVDPQLIAAVAGIRARNIGWALSRRQKTILSIHSIPAALFVLGSLDRRPSINHVGSTTINGIFIAFMCIPAILCVLSGCICLAAQKHLLPLPQDGASLIDLVQKQNRVGQSNASQPSLVWNGRSFILDSNIEEAIGRISARVDTRDELNNCENASTLSVPHLLVHSPNNSSQDIPGDDAEKTSNEGPNGSCFSLLTPDKGIALIGCMTFCFVVGVLAAVFIKSNSVDVKVNDPRSDQHYFSPILHKSPTFPPGCFKDEYELGTAIWGYLRGSEEHHNQTVAEYGLIEGWCVDHIRDFSYLFAGQNCFQLDISSWNVSSGISFRFMFAVSNGFNSDLSDWDVSSGKDFGYMFSSARNFNSNISLWDVSSGINFARMFDDARIFDSDLSQWDVSSGTNFASMFNLASRFNSDLSKWDVSAGTDFSSMFSGTGHFNSDLSSWTVSAGTNFGGMFLWALRFNSDLSNWDVSVGTNFRQMFYFARNFNSDLSDWDVSSGTDFSLMFRFALIFNSDLSQWDVSSGIDFDGMFYDAELFNSDLSQWDVSSGTRFGSMFWGTTSFDSDLSLWDVSSGIDFDSMFRSASSFNSDLSSWNVSAGTYFGFMFYQTTSFNQNLCSWWDQLGPDVPTESMLSNNGCAHDHASPETMCQACFPTASPSRSPSEIPTSSESPSAECVDSAWWTDFHGHRCQYYDEYGCSRAALFKPPFGGSAADACCACRGKPATMTPVYSPVTDDPLFLP